MANNTTKTQTEVIGADAVLERGRAALTKALGAGGMLEFLRLIHDRDQPAESPDGVARGTMGFSCDYDRGEVVITMAEPSTWMRFSTDEAAEFIGHVQRCREELLPANTGAN